MCAGLRATSVWRCADSTGFSNRNPASGARLRAEALGRLSDTPQSDLHLPVVCRSRRDGAPLCGVRFAVERTPHT
jgi:hypothetical protein